MKLEKAMTLTKSQYIKSIKAYGGDCKFCKGINQPYMVNKSIWKEVFPKHNGYDELFCCIPCFESFLGRSLVLEDFINCPINNDIFGFHAKIYCILKE